MSTRTRIAIIGCGPSGMSILSAFSKAEEQESIPEIVCFEKQDSIGGLWNYTWRKGLDVYGEWLHNSMYDHLYANGPKECVEMADYTFNEHFDKPIPSYPPRAVLYDYLMGKAKKFNIWKYNIRFTTVVRYVEEKGKQLLVTSQNLKTRITSNEIFDYVIVANGHHSVPNVPDYPGVENFKGKTLHSYYFRNASEFKGKTILIIGNSISGEDIAVQTYKFGAKECIISYRSNSSGFKWPAEIREVPQLVKFENDLFHFKDGTSCSADVLIFCTGYKHHYPFLSDNIRLETTSCGYPGSLYKGIVCMNNSHVLYVGAHGCAYTLTKIDSQAHWARDFILGRIDKKTKSERSEHITVWRQKFSKVKNMYDSFSFDSEYIRDLLNDSDYPEHGHEARLNLYKKWLQDKSTNMLTFRDQSFTSTISNEMSPPPMVPWMKAMDDSLQGFIQQNYKIGSGDRIVYPG